jgi:hypothetical protein
VETTKILWIAHLKLKEVGAKDGHYKIQDSNTPALQYSFFVIRCELQIYLVDGTNNNEWGFLTHEQTGKQNGDWCVCGGGGGSGGCRHCGIRFRQILC